MKWFFVIILSVLVLLTAVAWMIVPTPKGKGRIHLVWASDDNPARRIQIDEFNKLNPDYYLALDPVDGTNGAMNKIIVQSLAANGPDVFDCKSIGQLAAYVNSGIAWDITDELKKAGFDPEKELWPASLPLIKYKGRYYGMPTNVGVDAVWYNKDIFDKCKVPYPKGDWTWEEFIAVAQKLTLRNSKGKIIRYGVFSANDYWPEWIRQWGGRVFNESGTKCTLDSPEAIAAVQHACDLLYKYKVAPTFTELQSMSSAGGWGSGNIAMFANGRAAMAMGGRWWLCNLREYKNLRLGVTVFPHGKYKGARALGRATLINRESPNKEKALKFLLFEAGREYNELINHQADALAPIKKFCYTDKFLHDPEYPNEDFNAQWRDAMAMGINEETSPFIETTVLARLADRQITQIWSGQKSAEDAMKTLAREVNDEIAKNVSKNPALKAQYLELTKK